MNKNNKSNQENLARFSHEMHEKRLEGDGELLLIKGRYVRNRCKIFQKILVNRPRIEPKTFELRHRFLTD